MSDNKLTILFLIDYFHRTGGTERHLVQLVQRLPQQEFRCAIAAFDLGSNPLIDALRARGVPVTAIPVQREYTLNGLLRARELAGLIRKLRPDIVQTFLSKSDTYGAVIARIAGIKHLISSKRDTGALRNARHRLMHRMLAPMFERVIVVADAVAESVVTADRIDPRRVVKIYNGVDTDAFTPASPEAIRGARARLALNASDFVVGIVAGFRPEKNHDVFFAALRRLIPRIPTIKAIAVGGGPLLEQYRGECATGELGGRVIFTDAVDDVREYLHAMDVACLVPGSNEGFSNAVLESMAVGLPLVVTDVGGNREAVTHGTSGLVIPPNDENGLAEALLALYSDHEKRALMGRCARERVLRDFSIEQMGVQHARLYRSLCHVTSG